ncbi:hypothetical protein DFR52_105198 [Hoeflea marina]|uniref:DUF7662 domain-containing protein n=1 Tax=Hoeflea marina TaxID=274592 RepID=A0A317PKF4_9HYPH|nr:hypothetical protein [Hoeflea marina]PWV98217.1 hypothetical protein DFR52_105198 [Hoeflea marina]
MGKYEPLRRFLALQNKDQIQMSFAEIEAVLGEPLPASKKFPAWWSNNTMNNVMTKEWLAAGYQSEQVDVVGEKLTFRRIEAKSKAAQKPSRNGGPLAASNAQAKRPSYFGAMKGTLKIDPSLDLTEPADPEWGKVYDVD